MRSGSLFNYTIMHSICFLQFLILQPAIGMRNYRKLLVTTTNESVALRHIRAPGGRLQERNIYLKKEAENVGRGRICHMAF